MLGGGIDLTFNSSYHPSNSFQCSILPAKLNSITRTLNTKHWPSNTSYQCYNPDSHSSQERPSYELQPRYPRFSIGVCNSTYQNPQNILSQLSQQLDNQVKFQGPVYPCHHVLEICKSQPLPNPTSPPNQNTSMWAQSLRTGIKVCLLTLKIIPIRLMHPKSGLSLNHCQTFQTMTYTNEVKNHSQAIWSALQWTAPVIVNQSSIDAAAQFYNLSGSESFKTCSVR